MEYYGFVDEKSKNSVRFDMFRCDDMDVLLVPPTFILEVPTKMNVRINQWYKITTGENGIPAMLFSDFSEKYTDVTIVDIQPTSFALRM